MSVDPLAESYTGHSPYNYTMGNPIKFIDPNGMSVASPIFDEDGNFLGTDSEGFTGDIIIMDRNAYNTVSNNGQETLNHDQVMIWAEKSPLANKINDANMDSEGFSKIYTHVLKQMEGEKFGGETLSFDKLEGGIIHTINTENDDEGLSQINSDLYGNPTNPPINAIAMETTNKDGTTNITARQMFGSGMETVEMIQSTLGIHEYQGHFVKNIGGGADEKRAYMLQFKHKRTFNKLSKMEQYKIKESAGIK